MDSQAAEAVSKTRLAWLSVISNALLVVLKLLVGFFTGSVSIISEAIHSGLDLIAAVISLAGVKQASKPADERHTFGHGKFEYLSSVIQAILIFVAAGMIIYEALEKIIHGAALSSVGLGIVVMFISAAVNAVIAKLLMKSAKDTDSIALEANAWHLLTDVYTSAGVMVGLILIQLTRLSIIDPIVAIAVALFIIKAAWDLTHRSVMGLVDVKLPDEEEAIIVRTIRENYPEIIEFHRLRSRKAGAQRFVDMHVVVDKHLSVQVAHELCDRLEADIEAKLPNTNLVIHIEPCADRCNICKKSPCS